LPKPGEHRLSLLKDLVMEPYLEAKESAKESLKGMWSLCDKYITEKNWRKMQKGV